MVTKYCCIINVFFLGLLGHSGNLHVLLPYIRKSNLLIPDDIHDAAEAREFTLNTH